jgi:hypothetical protein
VLKWVTGSWRWIGPVTLRLTDRDRFESNTKVKLRFTSKIEIRVIIGMKIEIYNMS